MCASSPDLWELVEAEPIRVAARAIAPGDLGSFQHGLDPQHHVRVVLQHPTGQPEREEPEQSRVSAVLDMHELVLKGAADFDRRLGQRLNVPGKKQRGCWHCRW